MPVNLHKNISEWKKDIILSVNMYNAWFMEFAPASFRSFRAQAKKDVETAFKVTANLTNIQASQLRLHPGILSALRMSTCPLIAVDRLIGLSGATPNLVKTMEQAKQLPLRMEEADANAQLAQVSAIIQQLVDPDIFPWLSTGVAPTTAQIERAVAIVADRLCASITGPDVRNAQEARQLGLLKSWLDAREYTQIPPGGSINCDNMQPGTYAFRLNVRGVLEDAALVNIPVDAVIMPRASQPGMRPIFFEAKSAGDFANTNKRRKEEATKMVQLRKAYDHNVRFNLILCGYFGTSYLGYEAAAGIDWVWEHRLDDLALFGI